MFQIAKLSSTPLEYAKDQNTIGASPTCSPSLVSYSSLHEVNQVSNEKVNRILLQSFSMPSYCVQLTKILTSEGHVFNQELAIRLLEGSFPQ